MNNSDNFHGYPAFKDIFISVREYNARIKDLSVQSFSTFIIYLFRYRTGMETVTQHLNNIMCIKLHLSLNALRKSPISWFVQSICCIYISCIFSSLDVTRSPWDLISSKAWLNLRLHLQHRSLCVSFCPGLSFFLSKLDFGGVAVSFGWSAFFLLDSAERFKGLSLSAEDMANEVSPVSFTCFRVTALRQPRTASISL